MNVYIVMGTTMLLCVSALILKELKSTITPIISAIFCVIICIQAISVLIPILNYLKTLGSNWKILADYMPYLMKAAGISFIGTLCCDLCAECSMHSAVFGISFSTRCMLLSLSLPLISDITAAIGQMMEV